MRHVKKIYWTSTIIFSAMMLLGVGQYFLNTDEVQKIFISLGYPGYLVVILGFLKAVGVIVILVNKPTFLREWAYAGFSYVLILAIIAHLYSQPSAVPAFITLVILIISYLSGREYLATHKH